MGRIYAETLTKNYLLKLGITNVSTDGKIFKNEEELKQCPNNTGHLNVNLYDPIRRKAVPPAERTQSTGAVSLPVHRVVYAWFYDEVPTGLVVDHINNCKTDNRIENLQLLTPGENIWKERECNTRKVKCKLNKPRSYYEEKLENCLKLYEEAKQNHDATATHNLRSKISHCRASLRYWDAHSEEYTEYIEAKKQRELHVENYHQAAEEKRLLNTYKAYFKENGYKRMWHQMCKIIKAWDNLDSTKKEQIFKVLSEKNPATLNFEQK
jgi:hypothetical protein